MDYTITTVIKGRMKLELSYDEWAESPREWDNVGTVSVKGKSSHLSDKGKEIDGDVNQFLQRLIGLDDVECDRIMAKRKINFFSNEMQNVLLEKLSKDYLWLPIYKYEHGGISLSTGSFNCQCGSGQCGIIYARKEDIRKEFGSLTKETIQKIYGIFENEIENLSSYANGDVYRLTLSRWSNNAYEEIDSVGGLFSYENGDMIGYFDKEDDKEEYTEEQQKSFNFFYDLLLNGLITNRMEF